MTVFGCFSATVTFDGTTRTKSDDERDDITFVLTAPSASGRFTGTPDRFDTHSPA